MKWDRYTKEERHAIMYGGTLKQYLQQAKSGAAEMQRIERDAIERGAKIIGDEIIERSVQ